MTDSPTLFLVPTPLGDQGRWQAGPAVLEILSKVEHLVVETPKAVRVQLRRMDPDIDLSRYRYHTLDKNTTGEELDRLGELLLVHDVVLLSDAGLPCVADPGARLVWRAHQTGIKVVPIPGPGSIFLALMASGLNGQCFKFHGYLPRQKDQLVGVVKKLEWAGFAHETQIWMETPYRTKAMYDILIQILSVDLLLCIAMDINLPSEKILTRRVEEWGKSNFNPGKCPALFLLGTAVSTVRGKYK